MGTYHILKEEHPSLEGDSAEDWWLHKGLVGSYLLEE